MSIVVGSPGPLTTVQDVGRVGWRHLGIACAGAMDPDAMALANALVGNPLDAAVLEFTLQGPVLELLEPARIAVVGGKVDAHFESSTGERFQAHAGRPVELPKGVLRLGPLRSGNRAWLAIAGGIATAPLLGSRSTDLRGGFGGMDGRALVRGDRLTVGPTMRPDISAPRMTRWWIAPDHGEPGNAPVRYVPSTHVAAPGLSQRAWWVSPRSNRQGVRLDGAPLPTTAGDEVSAAVAPGTIQLPPDGLPIILLADAQTVGGYPRLGHVIAADLARFAQLRAGSPIHFQPCTTATAISLWRSQRASRQRLLHAIRERLR